MDVETKVKRACNGCTLCCFVYEVKTREEILTNPKQWCKHCDVGHGCRVFESTVPKVCKKWRCAWLDGVGVDVSRPDHTLVVMHKRYGRLGLTLEMHEAELGALSNNSVRAVTFDFVVKRRAPVIHYLADGRKQYMMIEGASVSEKQKKEFTNENIEIVIFSELQEHDPV